MADQRIFFEQGSTATGDSGEREDIDSIKPIADGERAHQAILRRPEENIRQRTERLRDAGEESKYLMDSGMRWILAGGNAEGLSAAPEPMPGITGWDSSPGAGSFVATAPMVVQPITTPSADIQETVTYPFTTGTSGDVIFQPISQTDPPTSGIKQKRAYNGANLIKIVWEEKTAAELAGATVPGYCNAVVSGDPEHILTISILDTGATQIAQLVTALTALESGTAGYIETIGLHFAVAGDVSTVMTLAEVVATSYGADYRMVGTFEREIHYIPTATFVDFFAANELTDGDTLAIQFADYVTDADAADPLTGRRERVPSNNSTTYPNNTTVLAADLFITSNPVDVYKIPLCIPLCKRIGNDLYWLDGTVIVGSQTGEPIYMGEHGYTVNRIVSAATTVLMNVYVDPTSPLSADPVGLTNISIQDNVENLVRYINTKGSMYQAETVTGVWTFAPPLSSGTPLGTIYGVKVNSTLDGIAIVGDYYAINHELAMSAGSVSSDIRGIHNNLSFSGGSAPRVDGVFNSISVLAAGVLTNDARGIYSKVYTASGATVEDLYSAYYFIEQETDLTGAYSVYGTYTQISNQGDLDSGNVYGTEVKIFNTGTLTSGGVAGVRSYISNGSGTLTNGNLQGVFVEIANVGTVTNGIIYGEYVDINIEAAASIDQIRGSYISVAIASGAGVGDHTYGSYVFVDNDAIRAGAQSVYGIRNRLSNAGTLSSGHLYGFQSSVSHSATLTSGNIFGANLSLNLAGGNVGGSVYGLYISRGLGGTVTGNIWAIYTSPTDPSHFGGAINVGPTDHPAGISAIRVAIDGAFATHSNGYEDVSTGINLTSQSVANVGILSLITTVASIQIRGLAGGVDGQWLTILNAGSNSFDLAPSMGTQEFLLDSSLFIYPKSGVLCVCDGTNWRIVSTIGQSAAVGSGSINGTGETLDGRSLDILNITSVAAAPNNVLQTISNPQPNQRILLVNLDSSDDINVISADNIGWNGTIANYTAKLFVYNGSDSKWYPAE